MGASACSNSRWSSAPHIKPAATLRYIKLWGGSTANGPTRRPPTSKSQPAAGGVQLHRTADLPTWREQRCPAADESKRQSRGSYSRRKYGSSTASLDDIDVDAGARTMDTTTMYASRILLSAHSNRSAALGLLFAAITQMLRVTDAIPIPPITTVFKEVFILMNTTRDVRQNYIDCIQDDLSICNATLIAARETEAERSATARRANVATRTRAQTVQASCSQAQALAMASIAAWQRAQSSGSTITSHYRSDCALSDREQLETMTGDTTAQRSATMRHVSGYTRNSNSRVRTLAEQIAARNRYDREYLYNKTLRNVEVDARLGQIGFNFSLSIDARFRGLNISAIRACATMLGGDCPDGQGARDMVNAMRQTSSTNTKWRNDRTKPPQTRRRATGTVRRRECSRSRIPSLRSGAR